MPEPDPILKTTALHCRNCKREFSHMQVIVLDGISNLVVGGAKVFRLEVVCTGCGKVTYWNQYERQMAEQTEAFFALLAALHGGEPIKPQ